VTVCDTEPTWCATARRISARRWQAQLPTGAASTPTAGGFPAATDVTLGPDAHFTVSVLVYRGASVRQHQFTGSYGDGR
jgi:hypothetical protein